MCKAGLRRINAAKISNLYNMAKNIGDYFVIVDKSNN